MWPDPAEIDRFDLRRGKFLAKMKELENTLSGGDVALASIICTDDVVDDVKVDRLVFELLQAYGSWGRIESLLFLSEQTGESDVTCLLENWHQGTDDYSDQDAIGYALKNGVFPIDMAPDKQSLFKVFLYCLLVAACCKPTEEATVEDLRACVSSVEWDTFVLKGFEMAGYQSLGQLYEIVSGESLESLSDDLREYEMLEAQEDLSEYGFVEATDDELKDYRFEQEEALRSIEAIKQRMGSSKRFCESFRMLNGASFEDQGIEIDNNLLVCALDYILEQRHVSHYTDDQVFFGSYMQLSSAETHASLTRKRVS